MTVQGGDKHMKPALSFQSETFFASPLGPAASIPDLLSIVSASAKSFYYDGKDDDIYAGYGKHASSYPYRRYENFSRILEKKEMTTAVLENDFLKAVFLPCLGGRLWSLTDKKSGENLLYTNDVIRPSNLAIRNAWVSGGVEWNMSLIGHSPFTMEQLFTARLESENGFPILRMYEYERIRKITYQMDFWLEEYSPFLNCRMQISNQTSRTVPMYWWSNMAVPEYEEGRVIAPAKEAYTNQDERICKVSIPFVDGADISRYKSIPKQADYFFDIPEDTPKYIANINADGYGLLHISTDRLSGRKLFSWGNGAASDNWQGFLTENAGRYVEIQAGLGKTQYGCVPMPPDTVWEWMEMYGPVCIPSEAASSFEHAKSETLAIVRHLLRSLNPEGKLAATKDLAKTSGKLLYSGSGYVAFENVLRISNNEPPLPGHLDFSELTKDYKMFVDFLETGIFPEYPSENAPYDFLADDALHRRLSDTIETINKENWYAQYQLGLSFFTKDDFEQARIHFLSSIAIKENPWALHALAVLEYKNGDEKQAASHIMAGLSYRREDLSYLKETWRILLLCRSYDKLISLYESLPEKFKAESRIFLGYLQALSQLGSEAKVLDILNHHPFIPDDLREGEETLESLWRSAYKKVHGKEGVLPRRYQFNSF